MGQDSTIFLFLLFLAVVFISQALVLPAAGNKAKHKELSKRLKNSQLQLGKEERSLLREKYLKELSPLDRKLVEIPFLESLRRNLELAGIKWSLSRYILVGLACCLTTIAILVYLEQGVLPIIGSVLAIAFVMHTFVQYKINKRLSVFEQHLPEALDIMRRMLQAGQPISQAFGEVGKEMPEPLGPEFTNAFNLMNYGYDMRLAILQMTERTPTVSMLAFSSAVLLQKETGGNLSENLEKVSQVLRNRFKLTRKIKTISAESRMSAWILVLAPFVLFVALTIINPDHTTPLTDDPRGHSLIIYGIISLAIGALWIRKIVKFEV
ncbi:type II secretion system F family protein [Vibrio astriarenae]|uniref:type II secretion system F family protein n=1 Tax=Vibrio astriarenae TaxID=1481923 RepID=UPI0037353B1D